MAAIGTMLLLRAASVAPQPAVSASIAGNPVQAPPTVVSSVLGAQEANRNASLGSPFLNGTPFSFQGYAVSAPPLFEARLAAPPPATEVPPVTASSSRLPETPTPAPSPTPTATPAPAGLSDCEDRGPLYCVYEVQPGETLSTIAAKAGIEGSGDVSAIDLLVASNRAALESASDTLMAGDKLRITKEPGVIHTVIASETLGEIARRYGVSLDSITAVGGNQISDGDLLSAGAEILVPNPTKLGRASAPAGTTGSSGGSGELSWPAPGAITSYFGPAHPLGIDIALMPGDPVTAAGDGVVTFAGGDPCCSYGRYVIIEHDDGLVTLYGHLSVLYVDDGERVSTGERIGLGGYTGFGTGPHLHFEVHEAGMLMDPLTYLP
jgi:murein DD-endopeptidase MepM/ murein hydrolase activator NlpD